MDNILDIQVRIIELNNLIQDSGQVAISSEDIESGCCLSSPCRQGSGIDDLVIERRDLLARYKAIKEKEV